MPFSLLTVSLGAIQLDQIDQRRSVTLERPQPVRSVCWRDHHGLDRQFLLRSFGQLLRRFDRIAQEILAGGTVRQERSYNKIFCLGLLKTGTTSFLGKGAVGSESQTAQDLSVARSVVESETAETKCFSGSFLVSVAHSVL